MRKTPKTHRWTEKSDGYYSNMSTKEMNDYQEKTGKRINPPKSKKFSFFG